jgi:nucleoside-diphosphate-sugar epimerase
MKVLVTGASGFVGRAVWIRLNGLSGVAAVGSVRRAGVFAEPNASLVTVGALSAQTDWSAALTGVHAVVHAAARVHVMQEAATDPLDEFRRVNVQGTLSLARQAAAAGVQRFIFISSIKVNGEATKLGVPFSADDIPSPMDPYGVSKMEAEQGLREIAAKTDMEVVIIRPPLIYGPGVKANFETMMRWLRRGVPLPLGAIRNKRSLVALDNLIDLILTCIVHPAAANQTFLVSDGEDVSTTSLLKRMGVVLGKPARLIPVPPTALQLGAKLFGRPAVAQRLCGSLQVDISKTRRLLDWTPPLSVEEGLRQVAKEYLGEAPV